MSTPCCSIYLGKFHHDLTAITGIMVSKGNHLQMAELFRLVKYYNLPIYIYGKVIVIYYGKHTTNCGKSPLLMGKSTINGHFQ